MVEIEDTYSVFQPEELEFELKVVNFRNILSSHLANMFCEACENVGLLDLLFPLEPELNFLLSNWTR